MMPKPVVSRVLSFVLEISVELSHEIEKSQSDRFVTRSRWPIRRKGIKGPFKDHIP